MDKQVDAALADDDDAISIANDATARTSMRPG
jgi:hypothetical protein